ncbi:MAG: site-specific DNA-methyltransferase [Nitrospinae bacterium]|nr:site-specific DNA-methyltransferase [Nitrospinota bacterium]
MDGKSKNLAEEKIHRLRKIIPEAFSEGKIDWEKLKAALGEEVEFSNERYVLNWAGKSDAFRILQSPTTAALIPCKKESVDFEDTENVFIEGENLEVLKVLQKSYHGKVKMIYIDPPYNTGSDAFIYPDKFSETREEYMERIGDKDETGYMTREGLFRKNSKDSGHYHSNWLSMMYPRLFLARNLLREDGVIFVSIDDNEVHNLRLLMNEVFGEENFLAQLVWEKIHSTKNDAKYYSDNHEYILCYSKHISAVKVALLQRTDEMNERYQNPDNDSRGPWASGDLVANEERKEGYYEVHSPSGKSFNVPKGKHWVYSKSNMEEYIADNRIWFGKNGDAFPRLKRFLSEVQQGRKPSTLLTSKEVGHNQEAKREVKAIFDDNNFFDTPKPVRLIRRILELSTQSDTDDVILDFFAGAATTAHAVLALNKEDGGSRKFICVQLPEKCDEKSEAFKAGYKTIAEIGKERIRRVIKKIKEEKQEKLDFNGDSAMPDLGFKVFKLRESNFKIWRAKVENEDQFAEQMELHVDPVKEGAETENILYELLLKSGVPLTAAIEEKKGYFWVNGGEVALMLEKADKEIIGTLMAQKPQKVLALDRLFHNNDQLKTNTALQMKDAGIDFKTI